MNIWENFYNKVFPAKLIDHTNYIDARHPYSDQEFSYSEIKRAIQRCKKNKAPGPDAILNEHLQHLPPPWIKYITTLMNMIWSSHRIPTGWPSALLTVIHKKGARDDPSNYRGIALINNILKILTKLIQRRLYSWAEDIKLIPDEQAGFRRSRSCLDNSFTIFTALQSKIRLEGSVYYCILVDFSRAFDSVPHHFLWAKLFKLGISGTIIRTVQAIYEKANIQLKINGENSKPFEVTEGVLQGDKLSPTLFIVYIADLIDFLDSKGIQGINIGLNCLRTLLFADDAVFFAGSIKEVKKTLRCLVEYFEANKLKVHTGKTQILVCRSSGRIRKKEKDTFQYKDQPIKSVSQYNYPGTIIDNAVRGKFAANEAANKAKVATGTTLSILAKAKADSWQARVKIFNSLVAPTMLYGAEIWGLDYLDLIDKTQTDYYKKILQLPRNTPGYMVRLETGITNLSIATLKQTWRWAVKILKMEDHRWPKRCLYNLCNLLQNPECQKRFNWVARFDLLLQELGLQRMFTNLNPVYWEKNQDKFLNAALERARRMDYEYYLRSSSLQMQLVWRKEAVTPRFLKIRWPIHLTRIVSQLRLANSHSCRIFCFDQCLQLIPKALCRTCGTELETVDHILSRYKTLEDLRQRFLSRFTKFFPPNLLSFYILESHHIVDIENITRFLAASIHRRSCQIF